MLWFAPSVTPLKPINSTKVFAFTCNVQKVRNSSDYITNKRYLLRKKLAKNGEFLFSQNTYIHSEFFLNPTWTFFSFQIIFQRTRNSDNSLFKQQKDIPCLPFFQFSHMISSYSPRQWQNQKTGGSLSVEMVKMLKTVTHHTGLNINSNKI